MQAFEILALDTFEARTGEKLWLECRRPDGKTAICRLEWALVHRYELISVIGDLSLADILCVLAEEITDERVANCQSVPKTGGLTREIF